MNLVHRAGAPSRRIGAEIAPVDQDLVATRAGSKTFVVIDNRKLERECFVRVIETTNDKITIKGYGTIREWRDQPGGEAPGAVLVNIGSRRVSEPAVASEVRDLVAQAAPVAVIVLAESEDVREMIAAVDAGARGYIPSSVGVDVIIEAANLTASGGAFLPASSVIALRDALQTRTEQPSPIEEHFTSRQAAVADALRRGKANKTIAYELNMCESTVKVHIRTIMKKLKATNRTQAAFKLNTLFQHGPTSR